MKNIEICYIIYELEGGGWIILHAWGWLIYFCRRERGWHIRFKSLNKFSRQWKMVCHSILSIWNEAYSLFLADRQFTSKTCPLPTYENPGSVTVTGERVYVVTCVRCIIGFWKTLLDCWQVIITYSGLILCDIQVCDLWMEINQDNGDQSVWHHNGHSLWHHNG